jgi:rod shape-determining protein MreC
MARAVDNRFRIGVTATALFCASLFLTAYSAKNPRVAGYGAAMVQQLLHPLQSGTSTVYRGFGGVWESYVALRGLRVENEVLRDRLEELESQNASLMEISHENERLRSLLKIADEIKLEHVVSNVIGYDPSNWVQAISIDRGSQHGIKEGMAVVGSTGVVGQVIAAAPFSAKVLLLTDHVSGIDGIVQDSRARGIVEGAGEGDCVWRFVTDPDEVKIGDRVITSGADGIYPKGLLIGLVSEVEERGRGGSPVVRLRPSEDLDRLETVTVVTSVHRIAEAKK